MALAICVEDMSDSELLMVLCGPTGSVLAKKSLVELFGMGKPRQDSLIAGEERAPYLAHPQIAVAKELYTRAMNAEMQESGINLSTPTTVKSYLCGRLGGLEKEVFWCLWLDAGNRLICAQELFCGTLAQTSVYPREVVKAGLSHNAAAVIFAHNHPSGDTTPSSADKALTTELKRTLAMVDIRALDHLVVGRNESFSFAENGLI